MSIPNANPTQCNCSIVEDNELVLMLTIERPFVFFITVLYVPAFSLVGAVQELHDPSSKSGIWVHVRQRRPICGHDDTNDLGGR